MNEDVAGSEELSDVVSKPLLLFDEKDGANTAGGIRG